MPTFATYLPKLARFSVSRITVAVTEKHARKVLGIKKDKPVAWQGIPLNCIGSAAYRRRHAIEERERQRAQATDQPSEHHSK